MKRILRSIVTNPYLLFILLANDLFSIFKPYLNLDIMLDSWINLVIKAITILAVFGVFYQYKRLLKETETLRNDAISIKENIKQETLMLRNDAISIKENIKQEIDSLKLVARYLSFKEQNNTDFFEGGPTLSDLLQKHFTRDEILKLMQMGYISV